jgi:hypothetical protein
LATVVLAVAEVTGDRFLGAIKKQLRFFYSESDELGEMGREKERNRVRVERNKELRYVAFNVDRLLVEG